MIEVIFELFIEDHAIGIADSWIFIDWFRFLSFNFRGYGGRVNHRGGRGVPSAVRNIFLLGLFLLIFLNFFDVIGLDNDKNTLIL